MPSGNRQIKIQHLKIGKKLLNERRAGNFSFWRDRTFHTMKR